MTTPVVEEAIAIAALKALKKAVLSKDTLRCSDYRKAVIMMYMVLDKIDSTAPLTELLRTAVEILYATGTEFKPFDYTMLPLCMECFVEICLQLQLVFPGLECLDGTIIPSCLSIVSY